VHLAEPALAQQAHQQVTGVQQRVVARKAAALLVAQALEQPGFSRRQRRWLFGGGRWSTLGAEVLTDDAMKTETRDQRAPKNHLMCRILSSASRSSSRANDSSSRFRADSRTWSLAR
jgi:hypothetical protein